MIVHSTKTDTRLLIVNDLDRLAPIARNAIAPMPISGVRNILAGIGAVPGMNAAAILVGHDPACRQTEAAIRALRHAAGPDTRIIFCCSPAYEQLAMRVCDVGATDYLIFPPERSALRTALLGEQAEAPEPMAPRSEMPRVSSPVGANEIARIALNLPRVLEKQLDTLGDLAEMIALGIDARGIEVQVGREIGRAGLDAASKHDAKLQELIGPRERPIGRIRAGRSGRGEYTQADREKLKQYGVLIYRMFEAAAKQSQWRKLAFTDDLTRLPNRRRLLAFLKDVLSRSARERESTTVLVFDIDDFKKYNDSYGHDAGDEILREVGKLFVQCSRKTDMVARLGGDEFVVVFWDAEKPRAEGSAHPERVFDILQRFKRALDSHTFSRLGPEAVGCLTISGGLARFPNQGSTPEALLEAADKALLQAKAAGKNRFFVVGGDKVVR
ncbi:MAG: GGDEF domain-containing protein [Phycisphaerales bacterium]|nr:GGDEF domain-containing protein [Phycisphaerales bacterium]MCB9863667.1 GGDEF domain-containing protein [Phycisphaerales bacterium]